MSKQLMTGFSRRIASIATAGAIAIGGVALMAPSAAADDIERTPPEVLEQIEAQEWPNYNLENPGPSVDIRFALSFLNDLGYITPDPGEDYTEDVDALIAEFDAEEGLNEDNTLESQTWIKIRNMHFPDEFDSYQLDDRGWAVVGIKAILNEKFGADLDETSGKYDADTEAAVTAAQEELGIVADGAFGWYTYKGVVSYEAGGDADASVQAPAEDVEDVEDTEAAEDADAAEDAEQDAERAGARGY